MISADVNFAIYEGSKELSSALDIYVHYRYDPVQETFLCEIKPGYTSVSTVFYNNLSYTLSYTKAQVDAITASGTEPTDKVQYQIDSLVKTYLEGITENGAVTFTI